MGGLLMRVHSSEPQEQDRLTWVRHPFVLTPDFLMYFHNETDFSKWIAVEDRLCKAADGLVPASDLVRGTRGTGSSASPADKICLPDITEVNDLQDDSRGDGGPRYVFEVRHSGGTRWTMRGKVESDVEEWKRLLRALQRLSADRQQEEEEEARREMEAKREWVIRERQASREVSQAGTI
eukprot:CAMPEP_0175931710 /NCGR_PEP_ID=MMETSP0108-20121206/18995_1 /TAXON_ID=195067 ORGANISM="Goniomonas pacifica, Strain CCMP1869" /NCGR_SAMPLE_ID=MMETSP0108 /ASSEMBLY_ACC=CAM_ASM_000204 /LENGTH=179 /DNA_ID=CAMNT_0017255287 /DNA_START=81 /DNA_END=620 /DNA_ORIENTATION=+